MDCLCFVSEEIYTELEKQLPDHIEVIHIKANSKCYESISKHPDVQLMAADNVLFLDNQVMFSDIRQKEKIMLQYKDRIKVLDSGLGDRYPQSVVFNGKIENHVFIHNLKYTDKIILEYVNQIGMEKLHVNQGYTNCSLLLFGDKNGITSDVGIFKQLQDFYDLLLIEDGKIKLPGLEHGFIGGCCGVFENIVYVNGDLSMHPDGDVMREKIKQASCEIVEVKGKPLLDIGGLIFWKTNI